MLKEYKLICSKCGKEYSIQCTENNFNKGKYRKTCSSSCANSRPMTEERRRNISNGVLKYVKTKPIKIHTYICDNCGETFETTRIFKKTSKVMCDKCIQKRVHFHEKPNSILSLSKRTISKIIKRAKIGCAICGWNESRCDIHHIIERKNGGNDDVSNLIIVCPNCHRVIHNNKKYTIEELQKLSIDKHFKDWEKFYHPSN